MVSRFRHTSLALALVCCPLGLAVGQDHHRMMEHDTSAVQQVVYTCPMDTDIRSAKPGQCPKCGMDLVRLDSPAPSDSSQATEASIDAVVQFLLTSAATDFHTHGPSQPLRFRAVRVGHLKAPDGKMNYMLCGQFARAQDTDKVQWTPFVTIKTSGYEQWLGVQAEAFSKDSSVVWDKVGDLSSSLQSRLDSLR